MIHPILPISDDIACDPVETIDLCLRMMPRVPDDAHDVCTKIWKRFLVGSSFRVHPILPRLGHGIFQVGALLCACEEEFPDWGYDLKVCVLIVASSYLIHSVLHPCA